MHPAPAVSYPIQRTATEGWILLGAWVLGAAPLWAWFRHGIPVAWQESAWGDVAIFGAAGVVWFLSGIWGFAQWLRTPTGTLYWDAQHWALHTATLQIPVQAEVIVDVQCAVFVLLRKNQPGLAKTTHWALLQQSQAPQKWLALRRALYMPSTGSSPSDPPRAG